MNEVCIETFILHVLFLELLLRSNYILQENKLTNAGPLNSFDFGGICLRNLCGNFLQVSQVNDCVTYFLFLE
jgi:hypothetical protein